jgi:hypothetical protein
MTSTRGPAPKRSDEKLGHAREAQSAQSPIDKIEHSNELRTPDPDTKWSEIAKYAYRAFVESPLNRFYTETDLAFGWMAADAIHQAYTAGSAMKIAAAESMMRAALFTESDRRRVRVEVTRKEPEANPTANKNKDDLAARRNARDAV